MLIFAFKWIIVSSNPISLQVSKTDTGNCEDLNELCEFIPLPHILCDQEKVKQECPSLCNNCPVEATIPSEQSTLNNSKIGKENLIGINNADNSTENRLLIVFSI